MAKLHLRVRRPVHASTCASTCACARADKNELVYACVYVYVRMRLRLGSREVTEVRGKREGEREHAALTLRY